MLAFQVGKPAQVLLEILEVDTTEEETLDFDDETEDGAAEEELFVGLP